MAQNQSPASGQAGGTITSQTIHHHLHVRFVLFGVGNHLSFVQRDSRISDRAVRKTVESAWTSKGKASTF